MRRAFRIPAALAILIGLWSHAHAQVPMTGAGLAKPAAGGGGNTVTVNATDPSAIGTYQALGASMTKSDFIVAAGTNSALVCTLIRRSAVLDVTAGVGLVWDSGGSNQAMSLIESQIPSAGGNVAVAQVWGLRAPTTGNKTLAVSWTNAAADNFVSCIAFDHVLQTNDTAAFPIAGRTGDPGGSGFHELTITSASGNMVIVAFNNQSGSVADTNFIFLNAVSGSIINAAAVYKQSSSSSTTAGLTTGIAAAMAGIDVQAGP